MRAELDGLDRAGASGASGVLGALGARVGAVQLAGEHRLAVGGVLGAAVPGGVQRGSVVTVGGRIGAGVTRTAFELAASVTAAGEWIAFVDPSGMSTLGFAAAAELGIDLERYAVVHGVPDGRWPVVVGALLDGMTMVIAVMPPRLALGDARRLLARARERPRCSLPSRPRRSPRAGTWPAEAALRIQVHDTSWGGLDAGGGLLCAGPTRIDVEGRSLRLARAG